MRKTLLFLGLLLSVFLIACGSDSAPASDLESRVFGLESSVGLGAPAGMAEGDLNMIGAPQSKALDEGANMKGGTFASATPAPSAAAGPVPGDGDSSLQFAQRRVISTASITIAVEEVQVASVEVRRIAENLGGFVEHLSSSGGADSQQANITIRVPQDRFFTAVERLMALGEVQNQSQGSQDVSSQFIDLEAQLNSAQRREQSLLSLLEKAVKLSDILTLEQQLNRVRTEIERLQGQLNFLERRVALATISVFLFPPAITLPQPPSGSLTIEAANVTSRLAELRGRVSAVGGKVDRVLLSERDEQERAEITFRVFPEDFAETVEFIESLGVVRSKELREGPASDDKNQQKPEEPNARISVILEEKQGANTGLILGIGIPAVLALAGLLGLLGYLPYRAGRRRASAASD